MKRILVATDLGERSRSAMGRAVRLAIRDGATLRIIHASDEPGAPDECPASHRRLRTEARIMAEELSGASLDVSARIASARPARAIVREANRFEPDLVVLGTHGDARLRDIMFSTTAMQVSRDVEAPLLVVQTPDHQPYAKVMIAVDAPGEAVSALRTAAQLAPDGEFFAVHAYTSSLAEALVGEPGDDQQARLQRELDAIVGTLPAGAARLCHARAREGDAMEILMSEWMNIRPDLLVLATHARHGLGRLLAGNLADSLLLACTSDILVVRANPVDET